MSLSCFWRNSVLDSFLLRTISHFYTWRAFLYTSISALISGEEFYVLRPAARTARALEGLVRLCVLLRYDCIMEEEPPAKTLLPSRWMLRILRSSGGNDISLHQTSTVTPLWALLKTYFILCWILLSLLPRPWNSTMFWRTRATRSCRCYSKAVYCFVASACVTPFFKN